MRDPGEGRAADGTITTGVRADRVAPTYRPVLTAAVDAVRRLDPGATLAVYGSVATGQARTPTSDVDLLTLGLPASDAEAVGRELSTRFRGRCREVAVAAVPVEHLRGAGDAAYGDRVFLRHYAVVLSGPDPAREWPAFPADARAARGFNGDLAVHVERWRRTLHDGPDRPDGSGDAQDGARDDAREEALVARLGRSLARKTLLATAGLVSVHDSTWTTDRATAARRWAGLHPDLASAMRLLLAWSDGTSTATRPGVAQVLDGVVDHVLTAFAQRIGLWT